MSNLVSVEARIGASLADKKGNTFVQFKGVPKSAIYQPGTGALVLPGLPLVSADLNQVMNLDMGWYQRVKALQERASMEQVSVVALLGYDAAILPHLSRNQREQAATLAKILETMLFENGTPIERVLIATNSMPNLNVLWNPGDHRQVVNFLEDGEELVRFRYAPSNGVLAVSQFAIATNRSAFHLSEGTDLYWKQDTDLTQTL